MSKKTIAVAFVMLVALAAIIGVVTMTAVGQDTSSANNTIAASVTTQDTNNTQYTANMVSADNAGFYGFPRGQGMFGMNNIDVSSEYTANVISILNNDSDVVKQLISKGYNVTSIDPIIKNVIEGNGTITAQADTARVILTNGNSSYATVKVDVANAKVTQIIIITRTVIDKTAS
jgi:hypothetical protein